MIDRMRELGLDDQQVEQMKERALDALAVARERVAQGTRMIRDYAQEQPTKALGVALGMGVLLGWLIKRR